MLKKLIYYTKRISLRNFIRFLIIISDRMRGLNFSYIMITPEDLGYDPEVVYRAEPSGGSELYDLLSQLNINESDSIIDIGCGQGSAMRTMHLFPFEKIHGIEMVEEIADIAIKNFKIVKSRRASIFTESAATFESFAQYSVLYFFNPFPEKTFEDVMIKIDKSLKDTTQEYIIIYLNPESHETIINNSNFRLLKETFVRFHITNIYTNRPLEESRLKHLI